MKPIATYESFDRPAYYCAVCTYCLVTSKGYRAKYCVECGAEIDWTDFPPVAAPDGWDIQKKGQYDWRKMDSARHEREMGEFKKSQMLSESTLKRMGETDIQPMKKPGDIEESIEEYRRKRLNERRRKMRALHRQQEAQGKQQGNGEHGGENEP